MILPPLVGIVTHNPMAALRFELLERTVRSIEKAFPTSELFLLDNGSTDGSWEAVGELLGTLGPECIECAAHQRGRWHVRSDSGEPSGNFTPGAGRHRLYYHMVGHTCGGELQSPFWAWSDDDIVWKEGAEKKLRRFWADPPKDVAIVGGYLEPVWHWNTPRGTVEAGGVRAVVRDSTPGGAWTFGDHRVIPVPCRTELHRFGYDTITCEILRKHDLKIAQMDLAEHIGWECSSHGNRAMDRPDSRPLDREKWGV
jgi:hypothetical protein